MSYAAATATAKAVLGRKGKRVTLIRKGQGAKDEIAGTRAAGGDQSATFNCVGLPPGRSAEFQVGSIIGRRVMNFYMARVSGSLDPLPGDQLSWGGITWKLIWVATYDPDGSGAILHQAYGEVA